MSNWRHRKKSLYEVITFTYMAFDRCTMDQKMQIEKLIHLLKPYEDKILDEVHCEIVFTATGYIIFNRFENLELVQRLRLIARELMPAE